MFKARISSRLCSSYLGLGSARYSRFSLRSWIGIGLGLDSGSENQVNARLSRAQSSARSSVLGSAENWLGAGDSWFGLAWLRAQFGSLSSSWCLGSARGSARLGLEARPGSRLRPRLRDLRSAWSPARLISVRDFILNSLWFGSALAWSSTRLGLVKSDDLLTSH